LLLCYRSVCFAVCLGSDNKIFIWNVGTAEVVTEVELPDIALSASWSYNGSLFVVSCKDKKIRIIDPRSGTVVQVLTHLFTVDFTQSSTKKIINLKAEACIFFFFSGLHH